MRVPVSTVFTSVFTMENLLYLLTMENHAAQFTHTLTVVAPKPPVAKNIKPLRPPTLTCILFKIFRLYVFSNKLSYS